MEREQKITLTKIIISAVLTIIIEILLCHVEISECIRICMYLVPYLIIGSGVLAEAAEGIIGGHVFDENFLMTVATIGAMVLGDYREGVAVLVFYQTGELFEAYAVGKSRRNISALMDIRPDYANVVRDRKIEKTTPDRVSVGDIIVVNPGERVPVDGVVFEGNTSVDMSALTGESVPEDISAGDEVISGSINISGVIKVRTTRSFGESTATRILELVENAASGKSKSENFISRFAKVYTPIVCIGALALTFVPPLFSLLSGSEPLLSQWIYRALSFLVISCPCALVISIPLTFFAGIGAAGRAGILIKGSNYIESLSCVKQVIFDKTGTLTQGVFEVTGIYPSGYGRDELLRLAAYAESHSSHPAARSIVRAYGREIDESEITGITEMGGQGVEAEALGRRIAAGNAKLFKGLGIGLPDCHQQGTVVYVAVDGAYAGHIVISDRIKDGAGEALESLRSIGAGKLVMLTGDSDSAAGTVAQELGLDEYHSGLMPSDKVKWVEKYLEQRTESEKLAFVGDGINDAPVLTRADIGIAMGALGSDAAIEAADVVLMDDDPRKISEAVRISRRCIRIVRENIYFAIGVKLVCLILGAMGITDMWMAIFADVGVMIITVLNAIRAMRIKIK